MPSKRTELRIAEVADLLLKDKPTKEILKFCTEKYGIQIRMAERLITYARPLALEKKQKLYGKAESIQEEIVVSTNKEEFLSRAEKRKILREIATGRLVMEKIVIINAREKVTGEDGSETYVAVKKTLKVPIYPTYFDRMQAVQLDNAMTGDNAPEKHLHLVKNDEVRTVVKFINPNKPQGT